MLLYSGLDWGTDGGVFIFCYSFLKQALLPSTVHPSAALTSAEAAQERWQAASVGSSDTKGSVCESSCFGNCQWVNWDKSTFSAGKHWRDNSLILPWYAVFRLVSVCYRQLKIQGQAEVYQPCLPLSKINTTWRQRGGCRSVLTFRMSSLAEWDIRILSHQAGHLVFMYCFPWLESSLYG